MQRLALGVEYLGGAYCGWQFQNHCDSIQARLQTALGFIADTPIEVFCAGRTDTGVNAIGQVVHFVSETERPLKAWLQGTNTQLPDDIRVSWVKPVPPSFHARFSATSRQYRYVIFNRSVRSAVLTGRVTWERIELDEGLMHRAAQHLIGEHDFSSFRASECQAAHARRNVTKLNVSRRGDMVFIDIEANAFLHHMVRNIAGTLMQIGRGEAPVDWTAELLTLKDRTRATVTAPANGLYFVNALYPDEFDIPRATLNELVWQ